MDSKM